jgi:hypothetical protein
MNRAQYLQYHTDFCKKMSEVAATKSHDYAGTEFVFANFCQIEVDGVCSTEVGLWTRFRDKTARLLNFIKGGVLKVQDEKIEDTILDACNYLIILSAYLKYKRGIETPRVEYVQSEMGPVSFSYGKTR